MIKHSKLPQFPTFAFWWQWWSDWDDICGFDYAETGFILQGSRSRTGKLRFRVASMGVVGSEGCSSMIALNEK